MADLPPRDTWVPGVSGLIRWKPVFDFIEVQPTATGKYLRVARCDGQSFETELSHDQVAHLVALLTVRP